MWRIINECSSGFQQLAARIASRRLYAYGGMCAHAFARPGTEVPADLRAARPYTDMRLSGYYEAPDFTTNIIEHNLSGASCAIIGHLGRLTPTTHPASAACQRMGIPLRHVPLLRSTREGLYAAKWIAPHDPFAVYLSGPSASEAPPYAAEAISRFLEDFMSAEGAMRRWGIDVPTLASKIPFPNPGT